MPRNNRPETRARAVLQTQQTVRRAVPRRRRAAPLQAAASEVRIIGGEWRGRKLHFPPSAGLRPTPDRVRETVFNWLQFELAGARCLDLFAGSGALGFEALSRGAGEVVFVERDPASARAIGGHAAPSSAAIAGAWNGRCDAVAYLPRPPRSPSTSCSSIRPTARRGCRVLAKSWSVAGGSRPGRGSTSRTPRLAGEPALPAGWTLLRSKRAGDVGYHLARRGSPAHNNDHQARGSA